MGFKDLVARLDDILREHDKGKSLKRKELKHLKQELEKKQAKYRLVRGNTGSDRGSPPSCGGTTR